VAIGVRDGQIGDGIAVEIPGRHRKRSEADWRFDSADEATVMVVEQDRDRVPAVVRLREIGRAVAVEVGADDRPRA
jgi:hypothetical protein